MGYDKRYEKVRFLFLEKRFYLGLFILLPAFFFLFASGSFVLALAKLSHFARPGMVEGSQVASALKSLETWAYVFGGVALIAGLTVAYALVRPARRLMSRDKEDVDEFGALGHEFRAMAATLKRHVAALESMTGGVITANREGHVTMANRQAFEILSGGAELPSSDVTKIFRIGEKMAEVLSGAVVTMQAEAETLGGRKPVELIISPIRGKSGIEGAVLNFRDLSRIRQMQEELLRTERLASIGNLTMTIAHEVRNPLASIRGFAQLIAEDMKAGDPKRLYIDTILKETKRLDRVVSRLYEMRDSAFEGESLKEMLHRVRLLCEHAQTGKSVKVVEKYDRSAGLYHVKDERVFHALYNIILNAYEAVSAGGRVEIWGRRAGNGVAVDVASDSELSADVAERVFESGISTKGRGRGAGLAIARSSIRQAGGDIDVHSADGRTVFTVTLPESNDRPHQA